MNHMAKEEMILFPYIQKINTAYKNSEELDIPPFGTVSNKIATRHEKNKARSRVGCGWHENTDHLGFRSPLYFPEICRSLKTQAPDAFTWILDEKHPLERGITVRQYSFRYLLGP